MDSTNDDKIVVQEIIKIGAIPSNTLYWTIPADDPWSIGVSELEGKHRYEVEVNFE